MYFCSWAADDADLFGIRDAFLVVQAWLKGSSKDSELQEALDALQDFTPGTKTKAICREILKATAYEDDDVRLALALPHVRSLAEHVRHEGRPVCRELFQ